MIGRRTCGGSCIIAVMTCAVDRCERSAESLGDMFCGGHNGVYSRFVAEGMSSEEAVAATADHGPFTAARRLMFSPMLHQLALTRALVRRNRVEALEANDFVAPDAD